MPFLVCNHLEEKRAACFTLIVFLMSYDCWYSVALLHDAMGWYERVTVLFPDHTHLLIATVYYPATALRNVSFQCLTSGFMQLASCFMQLAL